MRRGPGGAWLVDAETDLVYTLNRGEVWERGKASIGYLPTGASLSFYVAGGSEVVVLEPLGLTWSEIVARRPELVRP